MKKKLASAIIILLFILQLFIACGGENRPDDETSRQYAEEQTAEVLDPNARINKKDSLPADLNFNGQEIRILKRANNQWELDFPNELNGDIVNDAVYDKNIRVQERLNVKFKLGVCPRGDEFSGTIEDIRIICLSGDDVYDLISMNLNMICTYGTSPTTPFFMDLSSMPYLDLEQPWWNTRTIKEISHDGKSYNLVFGDSSFTLISYTTCVFYNKHIYNNYYGDPDELYKIALDGKWTYDVFADKCKEMYEDLNGDGVADVSDQFGLQFDWYIFNNYMLGSSDARMSSRDSEGIVQIDMDMNRLTT
ncbi:MAG: extracellular solute-binding protein, partial [Oscillospiraceae bacterium]|nr:extracellular solute-binding protein [Oscillospiraceae bacterium]